MPHSVEAGIRTLFLFKFIGGVMKNLILILSLVGGVVACSSGKDEKNEFAKDSQSAVIGGIDVQSTYAIASFTVGIYDQKNNFICTGSLISENKVLTAAHCIETTASNLFIVFDLNFDALKTKNAEVLRQAKEVYVHPGYDKGRDESSAGTLDTNDIAVIEFEGVLPKTYKPIEFLKDESLLKRGTPVQVAGFGANQVEEEEVTKRDRHFKKDFANGDVICTDEELTYCFRLDFLGSETLRTASVQIQGFSEKEIRLSETKGQGTCVGDSGGPLLFKSESSYFLVGVTSRGSMACDGPAIYTNALEYLEWIQSPASGAHSK